MQKWQQFLDLEYLIIESKQYSYNETKTSKRSPSSNFQLFNSLVECPSKFKTLNGLFK